MTGLDGGIQDSQSQHNVCPLSACGQPRTPANIQPVRNNDVTDAEDQIARPSATGDMDGFLVYRVTTISHIRHRTSAKSELK